MGHIHDDGYLEYDEVSSCISGQIEPIYTYLLKIDAFTRIVRPSEHEHAWSQMFITSF